MKYLLIPILFLAACAPKQEAVKPIDNSAKAKEQILKAEAAMCQMAMKEGFNKALLHFAADSVIKPNDGVLPIIGKANLETAWKDLEDIETISWKPMICDASKSGDLGYTFGNWQSVGKDTTYYGNYYTVWKLQPDNTWKFVIDGGNNTPKPAAF